MSVSALSAVTAEVIDALGSEQLSGARAVSFFIEDLGNLRVRPVALLAERGESVDRGRLRRLRVRLEAFGAVLADGAGAVARRWAWASLPARPLPFRRDGSREGWPGRSG